MVRKIWPLFLILVSCSSFSYPYYGIKWAEESKNVVMLGPSADKDKSFLLCSSTGSCVVMFQDDFFKLRQDYNQKSIRLAELEKKCGNGN